MDNEFRLPAYLPQTICGIAKVVKMWATAKATHPQFFWNVQNGINTQIQHQSITTDFPLRYKDTKNHRNTQTQAAKKLRNTGQLCNCCATPHKTKRQPIENQLIIFSHREPVGSRTPIEGTGILYSIH